MQYKQLENFLHCSDTQYIQKCEYIIILKF